MRAHNRLLRACLRDHGGREITHTGDGFIAVFRSIAAALACATHGRRCRATHRARVEIRALAETDHEKSPRAVQACCMQEQ